MKINLLVENLDIKKMQKKMMKTPVISPCRDNRYHVDIFPDFILSICIILIKTT